APIRLDEALRGLPWVRETRQSGFVPTLRPADTGRVRSATDHGGDLVDRSNAHHAREDVVTEVIALLLVSGARVLDHDHLVVEIAPGVHGAGDAYVGGAADDHHRVDALHPQGEVERSSVESAPAVLGDVDVPGLLARLRQRPVVGSRVALRLGRLGLLVRPGVEPAVDIGDDAGEVFPVRAVIGTGEADQDAVVAAQLDELLCLGNGAGGFDLGAVRLQHVEDDKGGASRVELVRYGPVPHGAIGSFLG